MLAVADEAHEEVPSRRHDVFGTISSMSMTERIAGVPKLTLACWLVCADVEGTSARPLPER